MEVSVTQTPTCPLEFVFLQNQREQAGAGSWGLAVKGVSSSPPDLIERGDWRAVADGHGEDWHSVGEAVSPPP